MEPGAEQVAHLVVPVGRDRLVERDQIGPEVAQAGDQHRSPGGPVAAPPPQVGPPGALADRLGMGREPGMDDLLGELGGALAGRRGGEVAEPFEALQIVGDVGRKGRIVEVDPVERPGLPAADEAAVEEGLAGGLVARHRILRHRDQLQRITAAKAQGVEGRPPGEAVEHRGDLLAERGALPSAGADQPLAGLDLTLLGRIDLLEQAHPRRLRILAA